MSKTLTRATVAAAVVVLSLAAGCGTAQSPNRQVSDSKITAEVKSQIAKQVRPSSLTNVEVNTTNGIVTLAGQVENDEIRHQAELVAQTVGGVLGVNNNLQVEPRGLAQERPAAEPPPAR